MSNSNPFEDNFVPAQLWRVFFREHNGTGNWSSAYFESRRAAEVYVALLPRKSKAHIDLPM